MRRIALLASMASALLAGACSSPAPEPVYYLLRAEYSEGARRLDPPFRAGLGRVVVAPYLLSSPGIVVETAPGVVRPAQRYRWAEPLDAGLRWFVRGEIARALGFEVGGGLVDRADWDYTIDVYISQLHGTMAGTALLEAAYVIRPTADRGQLVEYRFSRAEPLDDEGYAALVAAEQRLLRALADAIAESLRAAAAAH